MILDSGDVVRVEVRSREDHESVRPVPASNRPHDLKAYRNWLRSAADSRAMDMTVEFRAPDFRRAQLADLRSAYLIGFAAFGYRYVFARELEVVRRQLQKPEEEVICQTTWSVPRAERHERKLVATTTPLVTLMIQVGDRATFLPWIEEDAARLYERLPRYFGGEQGRISVSGTRFPWPQSLTMGLDFDEDL